ncbi:protein saal1 [Lutzomyia longipalpis]|uniref:protein saal1 n=1 Tax=Lutzomyia longipalpis TaxID=7200 RepID=UPI002483D63A|nr:protein saal1 [Lutzomyia longipalpis]XP_055685922.1 protein saal1 [Lutzomyia longipalpis]
MNSEGSPHQQNYNPSSEECEIDQEKLRGDAIGDSLYSERFVLSTLIKLTKFEENEELSEEFEKDLCILWDMTIDRDVIRLLLTHNVLELFTQIIQSTTDDRLTEILVGIIGNMCSLPETRTELCDNRHVIAPILELISSVDPPTLVQLMRFLHACLVFENTGDEGSWFEHFCTIEGFMDKFAGILSNSINRSLLFTSFEALNAIASKFAMVEFQPGVTTQLKDVLLRPNLIASIIEAFQQLMPETQNGIEMLDLTDRKKKIINLFLDINVILSQYEEASRMCYSAAMTDMHDCLAAILAPYCHEVNLLPPTANEQGVIENVTDVLTALPNPFPAKCIAQMITIWDLVEKYHEKTAKDDPEATEWSSPREEINAEDISTTILDFLSRIVAANVDQEAFEKALVDIPRSTAVSLHEKLQTEGQDLDTEAICEKFQLFLAKGSEN